MDVVSFDAASELSFKRLCLGALDNPFLLFLLFFLFSFLPLALLPSLRANSGLTVPSVNAAGCCGGVFTAGCCV